MAFRSHSARSDVLGETGCVDGSRPTPESAEHVDLGAIGINAGDDMLPC